MTTRHDPLNLLQRSTPTVRRCLDVAAAAASARGEGLYLVGGCVRDLLLRVSLKDIDLVVEGDASALAAEIAKALGGRVRATSAFGTCEVEGPEGLRVDVAMSRRETYASPAALPEVSPAPIDEDLFRRDVTINSMAIAIAGPRRGDLLDPAGGRADLRGRRLRLLHPASLIDDPTRAWRAARYGARFSLRAAPEFRSALAAAQRAGAFDALSAARIRREMSLIWAEEDPLCALRWCSRWGLLRHLHPRLRLSPDLSRALSRASALRREDSGFRDPALLLALLARSLPTRTRAVFCSRVGLEGTARRIVLGAASAPAKAEALFALRRRLGLPQIVKRADVILESSHLDLAALRAAAPSQARSFLEKIGKVIEKSRPSLRGDEIVALGIPRGPQVGALLEAIRSARLRGKLRSREEEEAFIRIRASRGRPNP